MRRYQQRQILELLKTIEEAQDAGLYADCQDGALVVGEYIEGIKGEGTQTVALLEEYCDLVYAAAGGELEDKTQADKAPGSKALRKHLRSIENCVRTELKPDRTEMVFLSYKASMSDSIESIYLAAKEDPDCDAYWIPIPFYEKTPDGAFAAQMHIDGPECYESSIECTDWQQYDIEARHPDVIFTFNPYDNDNTVTSVHPAFYCERLRNLTDCLVYVPYFVFAGDDNLDLFCVTAGCKYAHKVILQSEKIRQFYIKIFTEDFGSSFGNPKEKFIALGSPKFDKVINSKREDFVLPDKWAKLIDGKKVILYNTAIAAMLEGYDRYIIKLRQVLESFRGRDDVVLWWRPHPLAEATLSSMRVTYMRQYMDIVNEYITGGYGIYDNTPDLHRAIAWTDAYYGDWSSLVALYAVTGKRVVVQHMSRW